MTPLEPLGALGPGANLLVALAVGVAFGWFLERGGMGDARKLAGQFYLRDLSVLKVLFTAVITAMLGVFWLGRAGVLQPALLDAPGTFLPSQAVGGLIFGVGFVLSGLCPGTSCVALASGRLDGLAVMAGMAGGVLLFAELHPWLEDFHWMGDHGVLTLPQVLGIPVGVAVGGVALFGLGLFWLAERVEARSGRATP